MPEVIPLESLRRGPTACLFEGQDRTPVSMFVTEYPEAVRPFYHMRLDDSSGLTRSFDLLWNGLEITTGTALGWSVHGSVQSGDERSSGSMQTWFSQ